MLNKELTNNQFTWGKQHKLFNTLKLSFLKWNFRATKAFISLFNRTNLCFVTNIPNVEKCILFWINVGHISKSELKKIFRLVHSTSFDELVSVFNNEKHLFTYPDFYLLLNLILLCNFKADFGPVSDFMLKYSSTFTSSVALVLLKLFTSNCSL